MSRAFEEVRNEGIEEGIKKGRIEGRIEGIHISNIQVAQKMLQIGKYTVEQITEITDLTREQVLELAGELERSRDNGNAV